MGLEHTPERFFSTPNSLHKLTSRINLHSEPNSKSLLSGQIPGLWIPNDSVMGARAVGCVAALGPDTTSLTLNQLVLLEPFIRARDDPSVQFLWGVGIF